MVTIKKINADVNLDYNLSALLDEARETVAMERNRADLVENEYDQLMLDYCELKRNLADRNEYIRVLRYLLKECCEVVPEDLKARIQHVLIGTMEEGLKG